MALAALLVPKAVINGRLVRVAGSATAPPVPNTGALLSSFTLVISTFRRDSNARPIAS
jgi:hypothetical protein